MESMKHNSKESSTKDILMILRVKRDSGTKFAKCFSDIYVNYENYIRNMSVITNRL